MCFADVDPLTPSSQQLLEFVQSGHSEYAERLLRLLPLAIAMRCDAHRYLHNGSSRMRWLGISRVAIELAYAVDPQIALGLSDQLLPICTSETLEACGVGVGEGLQIRSNILAACARAAFQSGAFDRAMQIANKLAELPDTNETHEPLGWGEDVRYEILIRTFRFAEAWNIRRQQSATTPGPSRRVEELDKMLDIFAPDVNQMLLVEPAEPFLWSEATKDLLSDWVQKQTEANASLLEEYVKLPLSNSQRVELHEHFDEASKALQDVKRVVDDTLSADEKREDTLHRALFRQQTALRSVLSTDNCRNPTLDDNRHRLNYAAMIVGLTEPTATELEQALSWATSAADWSLGVGDHHGTTMAFWTVGLVEDRKNNRTEALNAFVAVFTTFLSLRTTVLTSETARALLSRTFRTLIPRIADIAVSLGRHNLAFQALEFYRGLAFADIGADISAVFKPASDVHYLAVSVFKDHGVFVALRTADGNEFVERLGLNPQWLDTLVMHVDPERWPKKLLRPGLSPRAELQCLIDPLQAALEQGAICEGDHVAVALDHPVHTVPIHYLGLGASLAVERLSFSRVASLADLRRISAISPTTVHNAATICIPTSDAVDLESFVQAFRTSTASLAKLVLTTVEGEAADRTAVLTALRSNDLVHLHAHGYFPEVGPTITIDAMREVGIRIAEDGQLPDRSFSTDNLLCPLDILGTNDIAAKHVSLAACVSGLGRPGRGGDMLGLEFAFRRQGVESVLASHWDVETRLAASFYEAYYEAWLIQKKPRATAWRDATLKMIDGQHEGDITERCAQCAFSLFGDWR